MDKYYEKLSKDGKIKKTRKCIKGKIRRNTKEIFDKMYSEGLYPRVAADMIAKERVLSAMRYRRCM